MTLLCVLHACTLVLLIAVTNQFTHSDVVTPNDIHNLKEEVLKMQSFKHPNVMSLIGVCENFCGGPAVVMPFMANGSTLDYLRRERRNLMLDGEAEGSMVCKLHAV